MNRLLVGLTVAVLAGAVQLQAAPAGGKMDADKDGKVSKKEFVDARTKMAEKTGKEMTAAAIEKQFAAKDKNKDGFLTGDELKPGAPKKDGKNQGGKNKGASAEDSEDEE